MKYIYFFFKYWLCFVMTVTFERKMKLAKFLHKEKISEKKSRTAAKEIDRFENKMESAS